MNNNFITSNEGSSKELNVNNQTQNQQINQDLSQNFCSVNSSVSKKTIYTKMTEELFNNLHKKGTIELTSFYDDLTNRNMDLELLSEFNSKKPTSSSNKKIINDFLLRNAKTNNVKRIIPNSLSQKNGLIKSIIPISPQENKKVQFKGKVRSPQKYLEDQMQFVNERNKKVETYRNELALKELEDNQSKPKINKHSKKIANKNIQNKNTVNRLSNCVSARTKNLQQINNEGILNNDTKNKQKRKSESVHENTIVCPSNSKHSKFKINKPMSTLYKDGKVHKKTNSQNNFTSNSPKKSFTHSRDVGSFHSNIGSLSGVNKYEPLMTPFYNTKNKNEEIIFKKVIKDIDIKIKESIQNKGHINYIDFCNLLFKLGYIEYDHLFIIKEINNNNIKFLNYQNNKAEIENILTKHNNSNKVNYIFQKLQDEQILINKAWIFILNNFTLNNNINNDINTYEDENTFNHREISILDFKIFIITILNLKPSPTSPRTNSNYSASIIQIKSSSPDNSMSFNTHNKSQSNTNIFIPTSNTNSINDIITKVNSLQTNNIIKTFEYFRLTKKHNDSLQKRPKSSSNIFSAKKHHSPECTFQPKITSTNTKSSNLEKSYNIIQQKHNNKMIELQKEKIINEMKECTFVPNNKKIDTSKSIEISNRLYNVSKNKKSDNFNSISSINDKECTFTPITNSKLKEEIFTINPLKNDPLVNFKIEQYEKARIEKKLMNYINNQGGPSVFKMKNSEELLKCVEGEHNYEGFKFGIEQKTNKDTFDIFKSDCNKFGKGYDNNKKITPLFTIEVKIKDRVEYLDYFKYDDPAEITKKFCQKYGLGDNSNEKILGVIEEKLRSDKLLEKK